MTTNQVESRKLHLADRNVPVCENLLDLGAGYGIYLPHLTRKAKRVVAVEANEGLCSAIKELGYEAILADARSLPFRDGAFECVWASEIIEHLPSLDFLAEIERVNRKTIVITMPNPWSPHYKRDPTHILKYSLLSLSKFLRARSKGSDWRYKMRGLGFYWIPGPGFVKRLTMYATYYLPWFSPTIAVVGRASADALARATSKDRVDNR